jgi:pyrimidine operon attenuation protein/uracil phosphoribosyltransferase
MEQRLILDSKAFSITIDRLCHQLLENHNGFSESVILGLQPRGIYLANRISNRLKQITGNTAIPCGYLDVTFFRDDFRMHEKPLIPSSTEVDFIIEGKKVVLMDDVLFTGRTIRAGLDAMLAFGRPKKVELLTLIDRRYNRDLPIEPNYVGKVVDTITSDKVKVEWQETDGVDKIWLIAAKQ